MQNDKKFLKILGQVIAARRQHLSVSQEDDMVSKFERLSPEGLASDIIRVHAERHGGN